MQECLVYLFTGFLESGKTTLIQETLNDPGFNTGEEKTLILLCEEGGVRYTKDLAQRVHADIVSVNAPEKLTAAFMEKCEQLFHPDRVVICRSPYGAVQIDEKLHGYKINQSRRSYNIDKYI